MAKIQRKKKIAQKDLTAENPTTKKQQKLRSRMPDIQNSDGENHT